MGIGRDVLLQIRLLLENSQYKPALDKAVTDTESAAKRMADAHGNASQDMQGEAGKLIAKLSEQNATFGMSEAQLRRYRAEQVAMSEAQRAATNALLDNLEAMEAQASAGGLARLAASAGALATAATAAAAVVVTAAAGVAAAYHFAGQETLAYEKAIILSGNAAGVTSGQLADMARRIDGVAGTQANAAAALATMTASGKVAAENLEKVSLAAIEMERATGQSVGDTEKIFAKLGDDPVKASQRLNESMHFLTASTYAQIKAADELGEKEAAASIAQNAAADALRQRAAQVEQQLGLLERAWRGVRDVAKQAWDNMLNVGRPDTLSTQIADLRSKIDQAKGKDPNRRFSMPWDTPLADLEQQLAYLTEQDRLIRRGTEAQAERNRVQAAGIAAVDALGKANDSAMTRQERAAKALDAYRDSLKAVRAAHEQAPSDALGKLLDPETIARTEAAILKQGETSVRATKASLSEYDKLVQRLSTDLPAAAAQSQAAQQGYNKAQTEFLVLAGSPTWAKFTNDQRAAVAVLYEQKIAREQVAQATEAEQKATLEAAKARDKALSTGEKELDKLRAMVTAQEEQNARLGLSKEAVADLDAAKLEMMATDLELQAIKALDRNLDEQQYELLKKQAQAYRDLAQAKRDGATRQAAVESERELERTADKAAREGERAAARIEQSLTDALMRGFESGKDFAQNLRDTVVNMFKTLVLRPIVKAIVSPVAGAITGALGLSSAAQAGQGINGVSTAISGASLLGSMGSLSAGLSYGAQSLFANGLGTTLTAGSQMLGAGSIMGGLGTIAGALAPIALGIGLLSSMFSRKLKDQGIEGTLGGDAGFEGQQYRFYKGGLFRSDKTERSELDPKLDSGLDAAVRQMQQSMLGLADSFGLPTQAITGFTQSIKLSFNGLDEAGIQAKIQEALTGYNEALAGAFIESMENSEVPAWVDRLIGNTDASAVQRLQDVAEWPARLLQSFGTSRDDLVRMFTEGLASGDAMAAGQSVADTLVASIQNAVVTNAAGQIFDIVNQGIVTPMLDAIATGASVADALSQATIDKTIERAKAQAQALAELYGNADFAAAMEQLRTAVGGALGQAGSYLQTLPQTLVATQQIDTAAQDAARAAEEAQRAWQQITDGLLADQAALQIELLRAQGREEEALARERALAIEGMDAYQTALYDSNRALRSQIDTLRELGELLPSVIDQYLTPEQRTQAQYSRIASDLVAAGLSGAGVGDLAQALVGASKGEIAEAATAIYQMTGVTDEMRVALLRAAGSLATLKDEAASAASGGLDAAYSALERAVQARRSVVQDTVNDVRAVFDTVRSAARELFGEVDSVVQFNAQAGRAYITQALGAARSTGYLPDGEQLSEAIRAARAGLQGQAFASQAEADYQKLVLANELKALQDISGDQLTEAEQQLKALDGILDSARAQIDALRGIDNSVMSVEAALQQFGNALLAATGKSPAAARAAAGGAAGGAASGAAGMPDWANFGVGDWMVNTGGSLVFDNSTGMLYGQGDVTSHRSQLRDAAAALLEAGQNQQLYDAVRGSGFTLDQADAILGLQPGDAEAWARAMGLPVFHEGTPYVPRTGFAVLQQGEAVIPRAFNPFTGGGSSGNAELLAELRALREQNARLEAALERVGTHTGSTATALNSVVRNNALVVETAPEF